MCARVCTFGSFQYLVRTNEHAHINYIELKVHDGFPVDAHIPVHLYTSIFALGFLVILYIQLGFWASSDAHLVGSFKVSCSMYQAQ